MKHEARTILVALAALLAAWPSAAQSPPARKPGLWEVRQGPAGAGFATKICMSEADAKGDFRGLRAERSGDSSCDYQRLSASASEARYRNVCKSGGDTLTMEMHAYDIKPDSFKVDTKMSGTDFGSGTLHTEARWLGADCKGVR